MTLTHDARVLKQVSQELETLVAHTVPAVVGVEHARGQGSGVVLTQDGYVLTNSHVVHKSRGLRVGFADGSDVSAQTVGADRQTDLAVLRVDHNRLPALGLAQSKRVRVGQLVVAIGNPLRFERSVSLGVVSALDRSLQGPSGELHEALIQTDAAINPGNSGGPLVDADGAVVGINTAIVPFAQGIGFAVPAHTAEWVTSVLMQKGEVRRPYLGIAARGVDLLPEPARQAGQTRAVRIFEVMRGTPAERAGLKSGDLLTAANRQALASIDDLQRVMVLAGEPEVQLEVLRGTTRHAMSVHPTPRAQAA